jgi:hypothetical protein
VCVCVCVCCCCAKDTDDSMFQCTVCSLLWHPSCQAEHAKEKHLMLTDFLATTTATTTDEINFFNQGCAVIGDKAAVPFRDTISHGTCRFCFDLIAAATAVS